LAHVPILIYGAGATSGQYAIQLLKLAGYENILATASIKHHVHLRTLGATHTFDYSSPSLTEDIEAAAGGKVSLILDCVTAEATIAVASKVISSNGTIALLLPIKQGNKVTGEADAEMAMELADEKNPFPKTVKVIGVKTFTYHTNEYLKDNLMPKILPDLLAKGHIEPNRMRLLDNKQTSLRERAEQGIELLRENKVSGEKVIVKINPVRGDGGCL